MCTSLKVCGNLQLLNLKGNTIQGGVLTQSELFKDNRLLETLILSSCNITALEENLLKDLTHLRQVDLNENKLFKRNTSGFYSLHFLQLNLADYAIVTVDVGSVIMDLGNITIPWYATVATLSSSTGL